MARKLVLTWFPQRRCWSKWYKGKRHYFATGGVCKGKSDKTGYKQAVAEWEELKYRLDRQAETDKRRRSNTPVGAIDANSAMATDWKSVDLTLPTLSRNGTGETGISELVDLYLEIRKQEAEAGQISLATWSEQKQKLDDFLGFAGHVLKISDVDEIDSDTLANYRAAQLQLLKLTKARGGVSAVTAKKRLDFLKRFIEWAYDSHKLEQLPRGLKNYAKVKLPEPEPKFFQVEEIQSLYRDANQRMRLFICLGLNCAYTQKDIATLEHKMIDWDSGIIRRKRHKTGTPQNHQLWPLTVELLKAETTSKRGLVLKGDNGNPLMTETINENGNRIQVDSIRLAFNRLRTQRFKAEIFAENPKLAQRCKSPAETKAKNAKINDRLRAIRNSDDRGFAVLRKSSSNEIAKRYQETPHLTDLFLAHSERAMKRHYTERHYELLFEAIEFLRQLYYLEGIENE